MEAPGAEQRTDGAAAEGSESNKRARTETDTLQFAPGAAISLDSLAATRVGDIFLHVV